jgi:hypothetical protein
MTLIETVRQQAGQAWGKAQHGLGQGQAKFDQLQAKRQEQALLRNLGAAYYSQQRQGGSSEAVADALAAMDKHVAAHQPDSSNGSEAPSTDTAGGAGEDPGTAAAPTEP